jgi:hypothetical protein
MVCIGKGVRPNVEFLDGQRGRVDGGIVADRYTAASLPGTFAAGDVAVTHEPVTGKPIMTALWTNAVEMGRCAGLNMAGCQTAYGGTFGILNATQVADDPSWPWAWCTPRAVTMRFTVKPPRPRSANWSSMRPATGWWGLFSWATSPRRALPYTVIREKMDVASFKRQIIDHTLHYGHIHRRTRNVFACGKCKDAGLLCYREYSATGAAAVCNLRISGLLTIGAEAGACTWQRL